MNPQGQQPKTESIRTRVAVIPERAWRAKHGIGRYGGNASEAQPPSGAVVEVSCGHTGSRIGARVWNQKPEPPSAPSAIMRDTPGDWCMNRVPLPDLAKPLENDRWARPGIHPPPDMGLRSDMIIRLGVLEPPREQLVSERWRPSPWHLKLRPSRIETTDGADHGAPNGAELLNRVLTAIDDIRAPVVQTRNSLLQQSAVATLSLVNVQPRLVLRITGRFG